jgi:hypothetical protein
VTTQCSYKKIRKKKNLGNHPMILFLDVQGEAEGGHSHFEKIIFILFYFSNLKKHQGTT